MTYELNLNDENQVILNIYLPTELNNLILKLIDHTKNESEITDYTLIDNQITYNIPSSLYKIEGIFQYYVVADNYESEHIEINSHICAAKNKCQKIEITSGEYCICIKSDGLIVSGGDTLPVGTIVEYDGDTVPDGYEEVEEDTGWQDIVFPDTSIANQYNTFEKCQYRRIGDFLYLKGLINIGTTQEDNSTILANIPLENCRPSVRRYITVSSASNEVGYGTKAVTITINSDGNIRNHNSYITSWISLDGIVIGL